MAPRRTPSKRKTTSVKKSNPKSSILQKHGKKLAIAALLGAAGVGYINRKYLKKANREAMNNVFFRGHKIL